MKINFKKAAVGAAATAAAAATTAAAVGMKTKKFCPLCEAKRLLHKVCINEKSEQGYDNGVALTPPMGWSSWNLFASKINEDLIKEIADAMKNSGLLEAGYEYVNIDDCWQCSERDEKGRLQCDKATFPHGMRALSEYVNSRGLKLGLYSSNGTHTCEDYPASLRHEAVDADSLAEWGIEYFKWRVLTEKTFTTFISTSRWPPTALSAFSATLSSMRAKTLLSFTIPLAQRRTAPQFSMSSWVRNLKEPQRSMPKRTAQRKNPLLFQFANGVSTARGNGRARQEISGGQRRTSSRSGHPFLQYMK